jgi:hypothetical protein
VHRSKLSFRWVRPGPSLCCSRSWFVGGLSACGSSSSTDSTRSTSSVVKKEARLLHVELTVINKTGHPLPVKLCDESSRPFDGEMQIDQSASAWSGGYFRPDGPINYADGSVVYSATQNPIVGESFVRVSSDHLGNNGPENAYLVEGESRTVTVFGHVFDVERRGDTDDEVMRLIAR